MVMYMLQTNAMINEILRTLSTICFNFICWIYVVLCDFLSLSVVYHCLRFQPNTAFAMILSLDTSFGVFTIVI
jgi:hypothetical protein